MEENRNTPEVTTKPSKSFAEIANIVLDWIKKNKVATIAMAVALVMTVGFILALAIPRNTPTPTPTKVEIIPTVHGAVPELNIDQLVANLENAGYEITYSDEDGMTRGQTHYIYAEIEETEDFIYIIVFENAEYALASYRCEMLEDMYELEYAKSYVKITEIELELYRSDYSPEEIESMQNRIELMKNFIAEYENSYSHGCMNGVIWDGTTKAVEDTRTK